MTITVHELPYNFFNSLSLKFFLKLKAENLFDAMGAGLSD